MTSFGRILSTIGADGNLDMIHLVLARADCVYDIGGISFSGFCTVSCFFSSLDHESDLCHTFISGGGRLKTISGKTGGIVPYYDTRGTRAGKNHFKSTLFFKQTWKTEVDWMSHLFINIKKRINYIFFQKLKLTLHIVLLNINKCMFIPK